MIQEVFDSEALPAPEKFGEYRYVRCKSDPYTLVNGTTGECFARRDGLRWPHPGYKIGREVVNKETGDTRVTHETSGAYCDHETYSVEQAA